MSISKVKHLKNENYVIFIKTAVHFVEQFWNAAF